MSETPEQRHPERAQEPAGQDGAPVPPDPTYTPPSPMSAHPMPPYPPPPQFVAAKPGVIPLRPLNLGEILDGAVSTMRKHPMIMLGVSAIIVAIGQVLGFPFLLPMMDDLNRLGSGDVGSTDDLFATLGVTVQAATITSLITVLTRVVLIGILTTVVGKAVLGQPAEFRQIWLSVRTKLPRLLGLAMIFLLVSIALFVPAFLVARMSPPLAVLFVVCGLVIAVCLYVLFSLAAPALILEDTGIGRSLRRSSQLVRPDFGRVFGISLLTFVIVVSIATIVQLPFEFLGGGFEGIFSGEFSQITVAYLVFTSIGTIVASTITEPFTASVTALLYTDQRMRREGLDIELARHASGDPTARNH